MNNTVFSPTLLLCLLFSFHSLGSTVNLEKPRCSQPGGSWPVWPLVMGRAPFFLLPTPVGPQPPGSPLQKPDLQLLQCRTAGQSGGFLPGAGVAVGRGSAPRVVDFNCSESCLSSSCASASLNSILITLLAQRCGERTAKVNNQVSATEIIFFGGGCFVQIRIVWTHIGFYLWIMLS